MDTKALLIGGAGFVGGYLAEYLRREYQWDIIIAGFPEEEDKVVSGRFLEMDLMNAEQVKEVIASEMPQYIFHLAAQSSVAKSWEDPQGTIDVNIKGCVNLLETIRNIDSYDPRILMIGSGEEYGNLPKGVRQVSELTAIHPTSPYAMTKAAQTMLGQMYANAYRMHIIMARPFNHIGPGQREGFVVADFCKQLAGMMLDPTKERKVKVGNLTASRDFTDVRDVVRAYALLIQKGVDGEIYNIGTGFAAPVRSILEEVIRQSELEVTVEHDPKKFRPIEYLSISADVRKLQEVISWQPEISLGDTVADTLAYWKKKILEEGADA